MIQISPQSLPLFTAAAFVPLVSFSLNHLIESVTFDLPVESLTQVLLFFLPPLLLKNTLFVSILLLSYVPSIRVDGDSLDWNENLEITTHCQRGRDDDDERKEEKSMSSLFHSLIILQILTLLS
jgi:hypothetical protein